MFWYDGQLISHNYLQININQPGLLYGASVFTTIRVYEKSLQHPLTYWQAHCDRLSHSIEIFNWQQPNWQTLQQGAELILASFPVLRMMVFPDGKELIAGRNLPSDLKQRQRKGIIAWVATEPIFKREVAQHKTGNYLAAYLARNRAKNFHAQEAILIDRQGNWLETSTGNLWGWRDGCWYTPKLGSGILPGIARSRLLNLLQNQGTPVEENIWTSEFVRTLQGISYSNCVVEVIPMKKILFADHHQDYLLVNFPQNLSSC
ncbi:aminotransferase class IV [Pleurocapsa sp. PCC 7319]|uniref:aminotransferase class IV n=1 Tax=Pleurocapsa sp. PCC 7319 TaxID=118161 RepID=UPI00034BE10E|nr:aminotransferase class IV [Pleurocapsa sp. PCC 7319]